MRRLNCLVSVGLALMATIASTQAEVKMPNIFGNNMVLQREKNVLVWGWAFPNEKILVKFNGQTKQAFANESGKWQIILDPMIAGGPFKMEIIGTNTLVFENVMVGEVWLCSGQSNMQWRIKMLSDPKNEIATAKYPDIRFLTVPDIISNVPKSNFNATWQSCSPETVQEFSSTAYFFGREIYNSLKIPIGLINSSCGGSRIEPWTPLVGFESVPELKSIFNLADLKNPESEAHKKLAKETIRKFESWIESTKKAIAAEQLLTDPPAWPTEIKPYENLPGVLEYQHQPTVLYNAMIHPLVPLTIRGTIWYQGESNCGEGRIYFNKMQALINGWRTVFQNKDMPFFFVQLAPYNYGGNPMALAETWEAQTAALSIPNTGMVVTLDISNVKSKVQSQHPDKKQEVGRRLALLALNKTYGQKNIVCDSPLFDNMKIDGRKAVITFRNAVELKTLDGNAPDWFEICDENGVFKSADAVIQKNTIILSKVGIERPLAVRFAWNNIAEPNLVNEAGLPASSFRCGWTPAVQAQSKSTYRIPQIPEAKDYKLVYALNPVDPQVDGQKIVYIVDKHSEFTGKISRIAYYLELNKADGSYDYVFVATDPFTQDISKIGVPDLDSKAKFQQKISNVIVKSNVAGVKNGLFAEGCNMEFWGTSYGPDNSLSIPGASDTLCDFGDKPISEGDYGSMQIHNYIEKQTVFAFNHWIGRSLADIGIGNFPGSQPDWTFSANAGKYAGGKLLIMVQTN